MQKKQLQADFFAFLNVYDPKSHQIKVPNFLPDHIKQLLQT